MKRQRKRRILLKVLLVIVAIISLQCLWLLVAPHIRSWQAERAIAWFEADPSQARVEALITALEAHKATAEQGSRIVALLFRPKVVMRESYSVGRPVALALESPYEVEFQNAIWEQMDVSLADGSDIRSNRLPRAPLYLHTTGYTEPGTYPLKLRWRYAVGLQRGKRSSPRGGKVRAALQWIRTVVRAATSAKWKPASTYECDLTIQADAHVVGAGEADEIALQSEPELDKVMRAAVIRSPGRAASASALILSLHYRDIPLAMSFACSLRLADGREIPWRGWHADKLRARAGSSGVFRVSVGDFGYYTPGRDAGTIVLKPDPELACLDPAIDTIWGVTLEYPIIVEP